METEKTELQKNKEEKVAEERNDTQALLEASERVEKASKSPELFFVKDSAKGYELELHSIVFDVAQLSNLASQAWNYFFKVQIPKPSEENNSSPNYFQ